MEYNPVVLSFHESLLRKADVDILRGPSWLNDTIISFYFEYLEKKKFRNNPWILFISPEVTQCVKISPENEIGIFLKPLNAHNKNFIFFALNDNEQTEYSGGSHWSLLVFSHHEQVVYHFDSSRGANHSQAVEFGEKILRYFGLVERGSFVEASCLQQRNGYDCGIHVLCNAEQIAEFVSKYNKIEGCPSIDTDQVSTKRSFILDLIANLRNK